MIDELNPDFKKTPAVVGRKNFNYSPKGEEPPAVSIITPFYNTGEVFHETAQTIINQSFQQWEWLIVNDGSTDSGSIDILKQYRKSDSRIRVINHQRIANLPPLVELWYLEKKAPYTTKAHD